MLRKFLFAIIILSISHTMHAWPKKTVQAAATSAQYLTPEGKKLVKNLLIGAGALWVGKKVVGYLGTWRREDLGPMLHLSNEFHHLELQWRLNPNHAVHQEVKKALEAGQDNLLTTRVTLTKRVSHLPTTEHMGTWQYLGGHGHIARYFEKGSDPLIGVEPSPCAYSKSIEKRCRVYRGLCFDIYELTVDVVWKKISDEAFTRLHADLHKINFPWEDFFLRSTKQVYPCD